MDRAWNDLKKTTDRPKLKDFRELCGVNNDACSKYRKRMLQLDAMEKVEEGK